VAKTIEALALKPMSKLQAISGLELAMKRHYTRGGICDGDFGLWPNLFVSSKLNLEELTDFSAKKDIPRFEW